MRRRLEPVVALGETPCVRCGELIEPGSKWHLDHRDDGRGWLSPSHASCNARAGWEKIVGSGAVPATVEMVCLEWVRTAESPQFKAIHKLIK